MPKCVRLIAFDRFLHIRTMRSNRVMVAGVRTVTLKAECFRPTLRGRSTTGLSVLALVTPLDKSSSPGLHTFLHHFDADTRFDLQPFFSPPANVAAIRLLSDDSLEPQFLNRHK